VDESKIEGATQNEGRGREKGYQRKRARLKESARRGPDEGGGLNAPRASEVKKIKVLKRGKVSKKVCSKEEGRRKRREDREERELKGKVQGHRKKKKRRITLQSHENIRRHKGEEEGRGPNIKSKSKNPSKDS